MNLRGKSVPGFLTDVTHEYNTLNIKLQRNNDLVSDLHTGVNAFQTEKKLFIKLQTQFKDRFGDFGKGFSKLKNFANLLSCEIEDVPAHLEMNWNLQSNSKLLSMKSLSIL